MNFILVSETAEQQVIENIISAKIADYNLPLVYKNEILPKINNKALKQISAKQPIIIAKLDKNQNIVASLYQNQQNSILKVNLDWHKLQRRIVTAGRKSELLLQACKLTEDSQVLDATAGFGHDSLILASTLTMGKVQMLEKNPLMVLLLLLEKQRMQTEKNWQNLMGRLLINWADMANFSAKNTGFDIVYLDPMFPHNSYQGAKVGKGMQVLQNLANPPSLAEEQQLFTSAKNLLVKGGKIVVKRPKNAPYLAEISTDNSFQNEAVRFDVYQF